jgi:hypothetical protein
MHTLEVRPLRIALMLTAVLLTTAYLPHPNLGEPLPQSLSSLVKFWMGSQPQS